MIRKLGQGSPFGASACGRRRGRRSRSRCADGNPRASADDLGRARSVARHPFASPAGGHLCVCLCAQRPDIADLTLPRHPKWAPKASVPDEAGRVLLVGASDEWLELGARVLRAIDCRKAVEERALAPQSINLIFGRRCALVGLDETEFAAHDLRSAYLSGLRAGASRCPG